MIDSQRLRAWMLCTVIACGVMACASQQEPARKAATGSSPALMNVGGHRIEIEKPAFAFSKSSGRLNGWLGYALVRRVWVDIKFRQQFPGETAYRYSFEEELDAREGASKIWSELKSKDHFIDPYFDDLHQIDDAGFFREYVWYCVPHPDWSQPTGLQQSAFSQWMSAHLPEHQVETWVAVVPGSAGQRVILGVQPHRPVKCQLAPAEQLPPGPQ
jgi:hypothetical protein